MKMIRIAVLSIVAVGLVCSAQAQFGLKLPKVGPLGGGGESPAAAAPAASIDDLQGQLEKSILEVGLARKLLFEAQRDFGTALGIKEQVDQMLSAAGVLQGEAIQPIESQDAVADSFKTGAEVTKLLADAAANAEPMNEEQKVAYSKGKENFMGAALAEGGQIAVLVKLAEEIKSNAKQIKNPLQVGKVTAMAVPATKLATLIPGDLKEIKSTWTVFKKVGADNNIEVDDINVDQFMTGAQ